MTGRPAILEILSGHHVGQRLEVPVTAQGVVVGRVAARAQLVLAEKSVSGAHARLFWDGHHLLVEDLGSRNGSWLNGQELVRGVQTPVPVRSELQFGELKTRFHGNHPAATALPSASNQQAAGGPPPLDGAPPVVGGDAAPVSPTPRNIPTASKAPPVLDGGALGLAGAEIPGAPPGLVTQKPQTELDQRLPRADLHALEAERARLISDNADLRAQLRELERWRAIGQRAEETQKRLRAAQLAREAAEADAGAEKERAQRQREQQLELKEQLVTLAAALGAASPRLDQMLAEVRRLQRKLAEAEAERDRLTARSLRVASTPDDDDDPTLTDQPRAAVRAWVDVASDEDGLEALALLEDSVEAVSPVRAEVPVTDDRLPRAVRGFLHGCRLSIEDVESALETAWQLLLDIRAAERREEPPVFAAFVRGRLNDVAPDVLADNARGAIKALRESVDELRERTESGG